MKLVPLRESFDDGETVDAAEDDSLLLLLDPALSIVKAE